MPQLNKLSVFLQFIIFTLNKVQYREAGFACVSNPCLYGICIDDLNSTFTCYCIDGYTGNHCQTNWDECWSYPCLNGGSCIDGIATYNCSCPDGFTGNSCEEDIDECISNPCLNNGICKDIPNGYVCSCHPGYSGEHCEIDLAVCNNTEEMRCFNGGQCIDGPGLTYTCNCQQGWSGTLCETELDECVSSPCQNGAICVDLHADYACACLFGYTGHNCEMELELCDMNLCENEALCLIENDTRVCYCVPDFHGDKCQYQYDECQLGVRCLNGGTCIDGVDNFTCSCPQKLTGPYCECLIQDGIYECNMTDITDDTFDITTINQTLTSEISFPSQSTTYVTESTSSSSYFPETTTELNESTTTITSEFSSQVTSNEMTSIENQTELETTTETRNYSFTSTEIFYTTIIFKNATLTTTTTQNSENVSTDLYTESETPTWSVSREPTHVETTLSTEQSSMKMSTFDTTTRRPTQSINVTDIISSTESVKCEDCITTMLSTDIFGSESTITVTTTEVEWNDTTFFDESTTISIRCSNSPCLNGGTCYLSNDGPKCSCKFGWGGQLCEEMVGIKVAAFTGRSYLIHHLNNGSTIIVSLKLRTLSTFGLIIYAQFKSNMYMCLYVQDGVLKFQFSCGIQTMLFSETKYKINTGYQVSLLATVTLSEPDENVEGECNVALRINNTVAMSGEQTAAVSNIPHQAPILYLGGFPAYVAQQLDMPITSGITGCMHSLQVDGIERNIYADAIDGSDITECSSLACLSSPCHNQATCIEFEDKWNCLCPSGYVGDTCNTSVCANNPCQFGATCVQYPGSGFLCLCPLSKHGLFCEHDLEIGQPTFSSSTHGYSSYTAYKLPSTAVKNSFELRFKFIPDNMEQISLLAFIGQDGQHNVLSDHLAISFIKGYITLTWNLGSGPRRIFTPKPIAKKPKKVHSIRIGRTGSRAWLLVDGYKNITGRSSGRHSQLNVTPIIYFGGHESLNFATLPHDLPLHTGFSGCIYDVELHTSHVTLGLQKTHPVTGRSVAQCGTSECSNYTCQHGGACLQHGATFTCLCQDGWFGPICAYRYNLCDSTRHKCAHGSTCVPLISTYECDCPLGKTGRYCEKTESQLSDVSFSGHRSYLELSSQWNFNLKQFNIEFELRPLNDRSLIMYTNERDTNFFISLSLQGGILEFRVFTLGSNKKSDTEKEVIVVRSGRILSIGEWIKVRAGRFGQKLYLSVNGITNSGILPTDSILMLNNVSLFLGGAHDLATISDEMMSGLPLPFAGCIRKLFINYKHIRLEQKNIVSARNIADCDGTPCGADVCANGGSCWLNITLQPHCVCPIEYTGEKCERLVSCGDIPCKNNGRCIRDSSGPICHCPLGWLGPFCEKEMPSDTPLFRGNSYIIVDKKPVISKRGQSLSTKKNLIDLIYIKFSTTQHDGLILWSMKDTAFIGIGIQNGELKTTWSFEGLSSTFIGVNNTVNDGAWHIVVLKFNGTGVQILIDNEETYVESYASEHFLHTDGLFYIGGFPDNLSVKRETNGIYNTAFNGCIEEFAWSEDIIVSNFRKYKGENIDSCFMYKK